MLQPLDVGVFSPLQKYYKQEVNLHRHSIDKATFPDLLARARTKAFTSSNIAAGFSASGIWPYNPRVILDKLSLPEPAVERDPSEILPPPTPIALRTPHELLSYRPKTPTTPRSIHSFYVESLSTITGSSPKSSIQRALFTTWKSGLEKSVARVTMHEAGEEHLRKEIKQIVEKGKSDTRRLKLNSNQACVFERGDALHELKRKRDEADSKKRGKKRKHSEPVDLGESASQSACL